MSSADKRKSLRRSISYPATILLGGDALPIGCALCNASQEGAQLMVAEPDRIPDRFVLALSADGAAKRKCLVVWRSGDLIGVRFVKAAKRDEGFAAARMMKWLERAADDEANDVQR